MMCEFAKMARALIFVMACLLTAVSSQAQEPNEVLILASYHPTMEWTKLVVGAIESELLRSGTDVEIHTEYMDTKHFSDRNHYTNLYTLFKNKAKREQYNLIITVDNNALLFLLKHRNELYPNVPIVFCGVDHYHNSMYERRPSETTIEEILGGHDSVTGVLEEFDYERTIEVALKLHPLARRVILINDGINEVTYYPNLSEEDVNGLAEKFAGRAEFENLLLTESNLDRVIEKIRQRRGDSVVLLTNTFLDTGANLSLLRGRFPTFCRRCDAPVYAVDGSVLGLGHLLGGYINDGYAQGKTAADMALQILGGESPGNIPIITKSPNRYIFKYPQLKKFGITPADLPPGSVILNQPKSFYYKYRGIIWAVVAIIAALALIVVILSVNILRRKAAEEDLRVRNIAIESSINAIAFADMKGRLTDVNDSFLRMWGYGNKKEVLGKSATKFWTDEDRAAQVTETVKSEGGWIGELTAKRKDNSTFDAELSASLVKDEAGKPVCIMASFINVAERKQAERKLKQYQFMVESAHDAIFFKDLKSRYVIANNKALEVFGLSREQVIGKNDLEIMPDKEEARKNIEDDNLVFKTGKPTEVTKYMTAPDGEHRWFQAIKVPQFDDEGNIIGLIGIARDITEQKQTERVLRENQANLQALFDSVKDFLFVLDMEGRILRVNRVVLQRLGYSEAELLAEPVAKVHPPDRYEEAGAIIADIVAGKRESCLIPLLAKDGTLIPVETTAAHGRWGQQDVLFGVSRDITERRRAEEALQKARDELEARVEQRTADLAKANEQLLSLASELSLAEERLRRRIATDIHDHIGQNLAISKIKLESLRESMSSDELAATLDEIRELIAQTIESSRSLTFELSPPVLYELGFEAAVEWLVRQARQKHGLSTDFNSDGRPKPLSSNVCVLLFQAVRELLVNVAKHAQARNVTVSTRRVGDEVRVTVEDDGVGLDASKVSSRGSEAGGFGLFSIRERLGYIGGRLDIDSKPGAGTQVTLAVRIDHGNKDSREKRK